MQRHSHNRSAVSLCRTDQTAPRRPSIAGFDADRIGIHAQQFIVIDHGSCTGRVTLRRNNLCKNRIFQRSRRQLRQLLCRRVMRFSIQPAGIVKVRIAKS